MTQNPTIKLLILDVDGVLTNGQLVYGPSGEALKLFHAHDGLGIRRLQDAGIRVAIISARQSEAVSTRMRELGVQDVFQGCSDKRPAFQELLSRHQLAPQEVAYMGDDLADLAVMVQVGLAIAPANAQPPVLKAAAYITERPGGQGAVREAAEHLLA